MITSLAFDNYGLLGLAQRSVDAPRLIGVALLVAGVVLTDGDERSLKRRRNVLRLPPALSPLG